MKTVGKPKQKNGRIEVAFIGDDRPFLIRETARFFETRNFYIANISFNLTHPDQDKYRLDLVVHAPANSAEHLVVELRNGALQKEVRQSGVPASPRLPWFEAKMIHLHVHVPDQIGVIAKMAEVIGKTREVPDTSLGRKHASFVHLIGVTENSGGAGGGTPFFTMRANVAFPDDHVKTEVIDHLGNYRDKHGLGEGIRWYDLD